MKTSIDLTDRDRLVLALDRLRQDHGYWVPNPSDLAPGPSWAVATVPPGDLRFVTWHEQSDEVAFGYGWTGYDTCLTCADHVDRLTLLVGDPSEVEDDFRAVWAGDTHEQLHLDEKVHAAEAHQSLHHVLNLHWSGDAGLVCEVLRGHGLDAREPEDDGTCIAVLPADPRGWPHWAVCADEVACNQGHHHRYKPRTGA